MDLAALRRLKVVDDEQAPREATASRRRFLRGATVGGVAALGATALPGGVLAAAAQTDDTTSDTSAEATAATLPKSEACETDPIAEGPDIELLQFLESLSRAASTAYATVDERRLLTALESERAHAFERAHLDHAELLHCAAGGEPVTENATLASELAGQVAGATDEASLLQVLIELEDAMAATATAAVGEAESAEVAQLVASIAPVLAQQSALWSVLAEAEPSEFLPSIQTTDGAFTVAEHPVA